ncbi:MAG: pilus assembly protein TadG-related protein [Pseudomonadota bacterium]
MRAWSKLAKAQDGNILMMFALFLVPIAMVVGLAVDGQRATNSKAQLQHALDAAVLVAAKEYYAVPTLPAADRRKAARQAGRRIFRRNHNAFGLRDPSPTIKFTFNETDGTVDAQATSVMKNAFGGVLGRDTTLIGADAQAMIGGNKRLEIALILDNSTSMFNSNRMNLMREAAVNFTDTLFDRYGHESIKISVVPWATTVNIMSEPIGTPDSTPATGTLPPAYGSRTVPAAPAVHPWRHTQNPFTGQASTRQSDADDLFTPTDWRGCIRAADGEREVSFSGNVKSPLTDAFPSQNWPLGIVPPKLEPFSYYKNNCSYNCWVTNTTKLRPDPWWAYGGANNYQPKRVRAGVRPDQSAQSQYNQYHSNGWTDSSGYIEPCLADPNEFAYLNGGGKICDYTPSDSGSYNIFPWSSQKAINGPNMNCPSPILAASSNRPQIINKLKQMHPAPGGTHADVGLMWGLRTLSPRTAWTTFFSYPTDTEPAAWDDEEVIKIAVLLTDGINVPPGNFEGYYGCTNRAQQSYDVGHPEDHDDSVGCWQHPDILRLDKGSLDNLMLDACTQMKDVYEIQMYTIAVDINDSTAIANLKKCASSDEDFYNITSGEIGIAFNALLTNFIRISK